MKTVLILTDFSESARNAAETGIVIAEKLKANILLLNAEVANTLANGATASKNSESASAQSRRDDAINRELLRLKTFLAGRDHTPGRKPVLRLFNAKGSLSANVQTVLREYDIVMVIMGGRSKPNNNSFFGSDIYAVLNKVSCPVLIVPQTKTGLQIRNLVFLTELPTEDIKTIKYLAKLSGIFNFNIHLCHISEELLVTDLIEAEDVSGFTKGVSKLNVRHPSFRKLQGDNYMTELEKYSQSISADILAMVHKKPYVFWRLFNEVHSKTLTNNPKSPLLILPEQWGK